MLSAKAKGKQRAVDVGPGSSQEALTNDLVIRFTEGIPDLTIQVAEKDVVRDVKRKIRDSRPQLEERRLKLILAGQLLTEATPLYPRLASLEQRQRRAATGESSVHNEEKEGASTTWLHCSVGPQLTDGEEEETEVQTAQLKPLRGFDRLAAAGFSEQDIANIRLQFHAHSAGDYIDQDFETDEDFDEHARALEEQWIDSFDNGGGASLISPSRASHTIMNGVVVGFFFPLIPLFFMRPPKLAVFWEDGSEHEAISSLVFSRRIQMGIIVGFLLNVIFGLWTYLLTSP